MHLEGQPDTLLAQVWSGLSFEEFLRQHLFGPLGMADTSFFCGVDHTGLPRHPIERLPDSRRFLEEAYIS